MRAAGDAVREPILDPVDRVSEILFGLFMALSFTGAVSVTAAGEAEIRAMFIAALGCNLAWGLVDAVMYLVRAVVARGRHLVLVRSVQGSRDAAAGRAVLERSLSREVAGLFSPAEVEAIRGRILALPVPPDRPRVEGGDLRAAAAVFVLVVVATFPVVLPFALMEDVALAKNVSRTIAIAMLFLGGLALGRHAGYGSWRAGFWMAALGTLLVGAIRMLGA